MPAVEESFEVEKARVESPKRELSTVSSKNRVVGRASKDEADCQFLMADSEDSLPNLQSKLAAMTAGRDEWFDLATETAKKLNTAEAYIALQLTLWEAAQENMDTHTTKTAKLQEQLADNDAELSQLSVKHIEQTNELNLVKSQSAAGATVLEK